VKGKVLRNSGFGRERRKARKKKEGRMLDICPLEREKKTNGGKGNDRERELNN